MQRSGIDIIKYHTNRATFREHLSSYVYNNVTVSVSLNGKVKLCLWHNMAIFTFGVFEGVRLAHGHY